MRITGPLFKWFGSKWTASKYYPEPKHEHVVEPFAGGAGYSLRHFDRTVILAESNKQIAELWRWLKYDATSASIREIPVNIPEGTDIRTIGLSDGQALLLKNWQRTNNVGDCWTVSAWGNKPGQWTESTRSRVAEEHHLIKHWHFTDDAFELFRTADERLCTWFVDPPYIGNFRYGVKFIDYNKLASICQKLSGQVIVCEAINPKTGVRPSWLPFVDFRTTVTSRRKSGRKSHELIWNNDG